MIFSLDYVYSSSYVFVRKCYYDNVRKKVDEENVRLLPRISRYDLLDNDDDSEER